MACCLRVPFRFWRSRGFGVKESGKCALNGGWHFSFLTGSAYVDEWQFFLRGKSGWRKFVFNLTLFMSEPAKWTCRHILWPWGIKKKNNSQLGFKIYPSHAANTALWLLRATWGQQRRWWCWFRATTGGIAVLFCCLDGWSCNIMHTWLTSEDRRNISVSRGGCLLLRLFALSSHKHTHPEPLPV